MSWVIDAITEPFKSKKKVVTKEDKLKELDEIEQQLKNRREELMKQDKPKLEEIKQEPKKVVEVPEPPQFPHEVPEEDEEIISLEKKLEILEQNLITIVNDINERVSAIERVLIRTLK